MKFNAGASYLKESEWDSMSAYLEPFVSGLASVSKKFSLNLKCGTRWPAIELSKKVGGKIDSFKLLLNGDYLEDEQVFFELVYSRFSKKMFGAACVEKTENLGSYNLGEMSNYEFVLKDIESKLTNKLH